MGDTSDAILKLFGGILVGIGMLVATLSGLCTVAVLVAGVGGDGTGRMPGVALTVGGLPFVIGIALVLAGRAMFRAGSPRDPGTSA